MDKALDSLVSKKTLLELTQEWCQRLNLHACKKKRQIKSSCYQKALIPNIDTCSRYSDAGDCSPNLLHYLAFHHTEGRLHLLLGDQVVPFCLDLFPGSFPLFQRLFPIYPHPWRTRRAPSRSGITLERTLSTWSRGTTSWKSRTYFNRERQH